MQKIKQNKNIVFPFGENWQNFLVGLNEEKIEKAQQSLLAMLHLDDLQGLRFLDVGCGSGLFSLAALRLGVSKVVSIDVDQECVDCAKYLNDRYGPYPQWKILSGTILDKDWVQSLGKFDIVYSWGVLHHTGAMWEALNNVTIPVDHDRTLFISIYNDQGIISKFWKLIKRLYNSSPQSIRYLMTTGYFAFVVSVKAILGIIRLRPPRKWFDSGGDRGMDLWHDVVDWVGGYPFETAKPHDILSFFANRGFKVTQLRLKNGSGCNEFVFKRSLSL